MRNDARRTAEAFNFDIERPDACSVERDRVGPNHPLVAMGRRMARGTTTAAESQFPDNAASGPAPVQKTLNQSAKALIESKIQEFGVGSQFRVLFDRIETPGGGLIILQGM